MKEGTSRRYFLLTSGCLVIARGVRAHVGDTWHASALLKLNPDGTVDLRVRRVEMGQGAHLGFAALVSDELGLPFERVRIALAPVERRHGSFVTGGSYTAAQAELELRPLIASVRQRLEAAAARHWGVAPDECDVDDGMVRHWSSERSMPIQALLAAARRESEPQGSEIRIRATGKSARRPAAPHAIEVSLGKARYGIDQRLAHQLFAVLVRAPSLNAQVASFDAAPCRDVPGFVKVVVLPGNRFPTLNHVRSSVAVLASNSWAAMQAAEQLVVEWLEEGPAVRTDDASIANDLRVACQAEGTSEWEWSVQLPAYPHLPMEPPNATAVMRMDGGVDVYCGTQRQTRLLDALEKEHGFPAGKVGIHVPLLGGGFGRRLEVDYAIEAALLARETGDAVQVVWTRADDIRFGLFRPPSFHRVAASVSEDGRLTSWRHTCAAVSVFKQQEPAEYALDPGDWTQRLPMLAFPYDLSNAVHEPRVADAIVPCAWWRGTVWTQVTVAVERALNALAAHKGLDAVALRLRHLQRATPIQVKHGRRIQLEIDPRRMRNVLERVARLAKWPLANAAPACGFYDCDGTYVAAIAQARPDGSGISRVWISVDCGKRLCDDVVRQQIEGSVAFALTALKSDGIHWKFGRVQQSSFAELPLLTLAEWPKLDIDLVDSDFPVSGIGEPAVPPLLAACASAMAPGERQERGAPHLASAVTIDAGAQPAA